MRTGLRIARRHAIRQVPSLVDERMIEGRFPPARLLHAGGSVRVPRTDAQRIAYRYAATGHMHGFPWHRVEWERGIPSLSSAAPPLLQRSKRVSDVELVGHRYAINRFAALLQLMGCRENTTVLFKSKMFPGQTLVAQMLGFAEDRAQHEAFGVSADGQSQVHVLHRSIIRGGPDSLSGPAPF
jgi:hypothetical protein